MYTSVCIYLKFCAPNHLENSSEDNSKPLMDTPGLGDSSVYVSERTENIKSIGLNSSTSHATNDAEVITGHMSEYKKIDTGILNSAKSGVYQSIISFLAKPQIIQYGALATTDTTATALYYEIIPSGLLMNQTIWKNKLSGILGFRGDLVITVQVNANRFQQGRYILAWVPSGGGGLTTNDILVHTNTHRFTLTQITQLPHVEFDLNCDTEATLTIPHVTAQGFASIDPNTGGTPLFGNNGVVVLVPYSPLVAGSGSTTASYSIFAHFENVDLAMPVNPNSLRSKTKIKRRVSQQEREQDSQDIGPIEGTLRKVTQAANILTAVPYLSMVATPVSWASNVAAQVAQVFGWSKPHNSAVDGKMVRYIGYRYTNADTADNSVKLGYMDSNEIEVMPGFAGSNLDEMTISYLTSIPANFDVFTWTTSDAEDAQLKKMSMSPRDFFRTSVISSVSYTSLTPLSYVASFFGEYRGSIKLTFKIAKTEFHTGRLLLTFWPFETQSNATAPDPNTATSAYTHREIIDIRNGNEFSFVIPYISFSSYRSTYTTDRMYGYVSLRVLNPLVAPSTVSSTVSIMVEASAAEDMEFARPVDPTWQPVTTVVPQSGRNVCQIVTTNVGNSKIYNDDAPSRFCVGERVLSMATVAKKFGRVFDGFNPSAYRSFYNFLPYCIPVDQVVAGPRIASSAADNFSRIGCPYALYRGAVRWKYLSLDANPVTLFTAGTCALANGTYTDFLSNGTTDLNGSGIDVSTNRPSQIFRAQANGGPEIEFPFYSRYPSIAVADMMNNKGSLINTPNYNTNKTVPRFAGYVATQYDGSAKKPEVSPVVLRAMGEDGHFGLFISIPPVYNYSATGTSQP